MQDRGPSAGFQGQMGNTGRSFGFGNSQRNGMTTMNLPGEENLRPAADLKPEVFFAGQIVGGFNFDCSEGLCCELVVKVGKGWKVLSPPKTMQTHTCYADKGFPFSWSHPLELFFSPKDLLGWPKGVVRVWRLDSSGKLDLYSYGIFNFPRTVIREIYLEWAPPHRVRDLDSSRKLEQYCPQRVHGIPTTPKFQ